MDIEGLKCKKLKLIPDERGYLMEILRNDDELFKEFGQVYISAVYKDAIKAWHKHKHQTDNICCIKGMIKLVVIDDRRDSPTYENIEEIFIGEQNFMLVQIPKGCLHGWKGMDNDISLIMNCSDKVYNYEKPDEIRIKPNYTFYNWERQDG